MHTAQRPFRPSLASSLLLVLAAAPVPAAPAPVKVLFLGDRGHHRPADRFRQLEPVLARRGIELAYTERVADLNPGTLSGYDGLLVYANIDEVPPEAEKALLDFVASGKGLIPLHCASYCFRNSPRYVELVGAQFLRHGTGLFRTEIVRPDHPVTKGFGGFESWDETYVHEKHNEDRVVLEVRADEAGREPWTWVRTHGKGRVFYTAWGHDERTWGHEGFQSLIERGIRWAVGGDPAAAPPYRDQPEMTPKRADVQPFRFVEARIPFYPAGRQWGVTGEPISKMQAPLDPAESVKHMVCPVELEPRLFAADPDIAKPIAMAWDERGRLWIAETVDYPNALQPEGQGNDRIKVCEDADSDGRADRFVVFADKLSIPTSLAFAWGGVVVHQYPHTLLLVDSDGDDVADERRVLFTGWGAGDTHAGPSNLRYGLDNWLYGIVGYSGFEGMVAGERHSFRQGFYRFKVDAPGGSPAVTQLELLRNTNNNSWGVGFSEEGVLFGSTANGNPSEHMPVPNRYYERVRGWSSTVLAGIAGNPRFQPITENVRQVDYHGRFTAAAGHALYTARTYPREYWNRAAFVTEATGHLVATFLIEPNGGGYRSLIAWNLLASDDEWTAPIVAEVGPDGNVWVIDWYNIIVQHNPTPAGFRTGRGNAYETDLRDKVHGRIYRLACKAAPPAKPKSLRGAKPQELVAALKDDNMLWRLHAQRLLVERGKLDVLPDLIALALDGSADAIGLNAGAAHALWTLHGLGALDGTRAEATAAAVRGLRHPSAGVRRNAALVLPRDPAAAAALIDAGLLGDPDGQVRLAAFLALADMPPSPRGAEAIAAALSRPENGGDRWIADAATSAAAAHGGGFLVAAAGAGRAPVPAAVAAVVAEHLARGAEEEALSAILRALPAAHAETAGAIVQGLAKGWPREKPAKLDAAAEEALGKLVTALPAGARGSLVSLASRLGSKALEEHAGAIAAALLERAADEKAEEKARIAATSELVEFRKGDAEAARQVLGLITPQASPELARGLIGAVGRSEAAGAGDAVLEALASLTPSARSAAFGVLLSRAEWTRRLLEALEAGDVGLADLTLDQKQALAAHPDRRIARRGRALLEKGGGLPSPDREAVLQELLPLARRSGDAGAGKGVFVEQCSKCHVHGTEGNKVGPDLTGMAVHPKEELLTQIIDPSRSVEGNYRAYTVVTKDMRVLSGLLASETRTSIELFDSEGKVHSVLREDVSQLEASAKSLMPDGFEKQVPPEAIADLLEFLAQRGQFLPLPLGKVATVVSTRGMFFSEEAQVERLVFDDWSPKVFEGVPFQLVDPQGGRVPNAILLYGPQGVIPPRMPKSVTLPLNAKAKAVHMLGGVSGWGYPLGERGSVTVTLRLRYADGSTEEHPLKNGEHFADYIRRVDVPGSKFAYRLRGQQLRYLAVHPKRDEMIREIELTKGPDATAPVVMALTAELY